MLILGIDPGSRIMGYGIIEQHNVQPKYVTSGCIKVAALSWPERLKQIYQDITHIISEFRPQQVAIEEVFVALNARSALKLGQARGVAIAAAACQNLDVAEYSARRIKQAVVGYGNADKSQVQHMIKSMLNLSQAPSTDAADALAVAMCHGSTQGKLL